MRKNLGWLLLLLVVFSLCGPGVTLASAAEKSGQVSGSAVNVRSGPGTSYSIVSQAAKDAAVTILEEQDEWCKIRLADGTEGWIAKKFVLVGAGTPAMETKKPAGEEKTSPAKQEMLSPSGSGSHEGGSALGIILKWTCFLGAGATGYLAYNEHTQGNDAYDEYKNMFDANGALLSGNTADGAESKRQVAIDHDGTANTYMIASGALFGAFLVQQLFLGKHHDQAQGVSDPQPPITWNPVAGELRASVVLARF